jgi:hypothetical protein
MRHRALPPCFTIAALAALVPLSACRSARPEEAAPVAPARVETVAATGGEQVLLTPEAARRIGIETAPVTEAEHLPTGTVRVVPYSSILYDADGHSRVYVAVDPLTFRSVGVTVDSISGDRVLLSDGPPAGTPVVTRGANELFGVETGIGEFE